jgi:ELWxxDGT repeat protein
METTITTNINSSLVPINVTKAKKLNPSQLINVDGTVYFEGYDGSQWGLYKLDASDNPVLIGDPKTYAHLGISMITNTNGTIYFIGADSKQQGLYRIEPSTGLPVRLGDMIINTGNGGPSGNIVNLGNSDYFLANNGDKQLWKIDRSSGALSKVIPNGLPDNFDFTIDYPNTDNGFRGTNITAIGDNLYFRGSGQVWKFDPITNNVSPIQITDQTNYIPGEFHQLGDVLLFKTHSLSSSQELYRIDVISNEATLVSDPKFASSKYVIDDNNFIDVNGTIHFTTNYGNEIWKIDSTGKAVLAGTISQGGKTNEPSNFVNVNGTLCFSFDDGVHQTQIWKLNSDGTVSSITNLTPNPSYGKTFVGGLTAIGDRLYFTADDAQYGGELRELDITTGTVITLDMSPGLYASSPASSSLGSKIINVNGTPYFASSIQPGGNSIFKLSSAGTTTPTTPITPTTPTTPTTTTTTVEPAIVVTATDKSAAETKTGETANNGQFVLTRKGDVSAAQEVSYLLSGTAVNGVDYEKLSGKVTFAAGANTAIVDVKNIVDDNIYEGDENILLSIVPSSQDISVGTSSGTSGAPFVIASNLTNAEILNKLLGVTTGLSNINLTVTGNREAYGTFDNAPFDIGAGIVLSTGKVTSLVGANNSDATSTSFSGSDPDGGFDPITLKIDFDTDNTANRVFFQYVFGSEEFTEFSGTAFNDIFTLTLNGVNLAKLTDGKTASINNLTPSQTPSTWSSDYIDNPSQTGPLSSKVILDGYTKTLTFSGDLIPNAKNTLEIKIKDVSDSILDSAVFLKGGSLGIVDPTTLANAITIADNDLPPTISIADVSFNEGKTGTNNNATFTVSLSNPSSRVTTVDYATADGTALAGVDYTKVESTTVSFAPGEISKKIIVPIIGDLVDETDKNFQVNLSKPTSATLAAKATATGTILNDDTPLSIAVIDNSAAETKLGETPNPGQFVITRSGDLNKTLTVKYKLAGTATNGDDYQNITGTSIFAAGVDKALVDINPIEDSIYEGAETVALSVSTDDYFVTGANSVTVTISDNDPIDPKLIEPAKNILSIEGGSAKTLMKFSKVAQQGTNRSEVLAFVVDDDLGRINGIKPGESGYLAAALDRAQTLFSTLGNSEFDKQNDNNSARYLNVTPGKRVEFLEIVNDTLDAVKSDLLAGKATANVLFSIPEANASNATPVKFTAIPDQNSYEIDFKDLVLKVEAIDNLNLPIGNGFQGKSEGQLIDLRAYGNAQAIVDTKTIGDAAYSNYVGLYQVEDEKGTLANGLKPGDAGYAEAAIKAAVMTTIFKSQADNNLSIQGGKILAPVVIANGTFDEFLSKNPENKAEGGIHAYFNYIGANTDKVDHFRLLGDNKFGVEDLYGGGDRDYNDLIFQMNVKS